MEHLAQPQGTSPCAAQAKGARLRPWLIGVLVLAIAIALYAGWGWLAAVGATTVLIAFAPCLVMCALALCMDRKSKRE